VSAILPSAASAMYGKQAISAIVGRSSSNHWRGAKCHSIVARVASDLVVAAGLGITIMSEWQDLPGITYIPIADCTIERTIGLVWRKEQDDDAVRAFCTFAASHQW
jgi:DNA-binding transcriptional LysR family regulator